MTWFVLAMIAYPEKQRKCQEELERVIGRSRMPTLADQDSLPYVRATVRELLRWRSVGPLGELSNQRRPLMVTCLKCFRDSYHALFDEGTVPDSSPFTHGNISV